MAAPSVATAAASGNVQSVKQLIQEGADINQRAKDGMTPLGIAAFWGYADIVQLLLEASADVNATNNGSLWTPLHCAAFQGHGKVIMKIMEHSKPDLNCKDKKGRTPIDFGSALDAIWPFFAAAGCKRTPKTQLLRMEIIHKASDMDPSIPPSYSPFSSHGSTYLMQSSPVSYSNAAMAVANATGDVLAGVADDASQWQTSTRTPSFSVWNR